MTVSIFLLVMASQFFIGKRKDIERAGRSDPQQRRVDSTFQDRKSGGHNMGKPALSSRVPSDSVRLKIIVVGGGIAGLGAAITLSRAGHNVTVCCWKTYWKMQSRNELRRSWRRAIPRRRRVSWLLSAATQFEYWILSVSLRCLETCILRNWDCWWSWQILILSARELWPCQRSGSEIIKWTLTYTTPGFGDKCPYFSRVS